MPLEKYLQTAKEEFPYLFEEYGFKVVFREEGEGRDWGRDAFGLESDVYRMRIFFSRQGGGNLIFFGPLGSLFFNEYFEWVEIANLISYLNRQDIDWSELKQEGKKPPTKSELGRVSFRIQSRLLKPHCPGVFEMFNSPEAMAVWKPDYKRYIHEHD